MRLTTLTLALFPISAFAAGSETPATPTPSETTTVCADGLVWDIATQSCMTPEQSTNDDSARLNDVRELAYEGQLVAALDVLRSLEDQTSPLALTYYGFVHRQLGDSARGMTFYQAALQADPDNLLARGEGWPMTKCSRAKWHWRKSS